MASGEAFVEFIVDQVAGAGKVSSRKMFGEYALYCDGKVVALICDDQLFVKPTMEGRAFVADAMEAPPYPGAKPYLLVQDHLDDRDWLTELIRITARALPEPAVKKGKRGGQPAGPDPAK